MYGIFPCIYPWKSTTCRYTTIHGSYGFYSLGNPWQFFQDPCHPVSQYCILESNSKFFEHKVCEVTQLVCRLDTGDIQSASSRFNSMYWPGLFGSQEKFQDSGFACPKQPSKREVWWLVCKWLWVEKCHSLLADGDPGPNHGPLNHPHIWNPPLQEIPVPEYKETGTQGSFEGCCELLELPRISRVRPLSLKEMGQHGTHAVAMSWESASRTPLCNSLIVEQLFEYVRVPQSWNEAHVDANTKEKAHAAG